MKISGASGASPSAPSRPGAGAASGFSLPSAGGAEGASRVQSTQSALGVGSIDALLALQEVGDPLERRRRAVSRAGVILDVLDDIKLALLDGGVPEGALGRLVAAVRAERGEAGDDPRLKALLDEIETRAAVELAKLEVARAALSSPVT